MGRNVVLHVGLPKCASSSVQRALLESDKQLRRHGIRYPATGRTTGGYRSHTIWYTSDGDEVDALIEGLDTEVDPDDTVVLSSEAFTSMPTWPEALHTVTNRLTEAYGPGRVTVLVLLRNHFTFAESCFAQFVKAGLLGVQKPRFYRRFEPSITGFSQAFAAEYGHHFFSYRDFLRRIDEATPGAELDVLSIERADHDGRDITEVLFERLGADPPTATERRNERLETRQLLALNDAQVRYGPVEYRPHMKALLKATRGSDEPRAFSPTLHITTPLYEAICQAQDEDRADLGARPGRFDAVLARSDAADANRFRSGGATLTDRDRSAVDRVMAR